MDSRPSIIIERPFNRPIAVKWITTLGPEVEGIRSGKITITLGARSASVIGINCLANSSVVVFDARVQLRGQRPDDGMPCIGSRDLVALPKFAREFLGALTYRFERTWGTIYRELVPRDEFGLRGIGRISINPIELEQDRVSRYTYDKGTGLNLQSTKIH